MIAIKMARTMATEIAMVKNILKKMVMVRTMNAIMKTMAMFKIMMKKTAMVNNISKEVAMAEIQLHQIQILLRMFKSHRSDDQERKSMIRKTVRSSAQRKMHK